MKTFTVTVPHPGPAMTHVVVEADYYRVEAGVITFRRHAGRGEDYPEAVKTFAPGYWADVTLGVQVERSPVPVIDHHSDRMRGLDFAPERIAS